MIENYRKWFKIAFAAVVFGGFAFLVGFSYKYHIPQLESWLLLETEKMSAKYSPFRVWPEKLKINLFPLGAKIYNVKVMPDDTIRDTLAPATVKKIQVNLSILELFRGRIHVKEVVLTEPDFILFVRKKPKGKKNQQKVEKTKSSELSFKLLRDLPLDKVVIKDLKLRADIQPSNLRLKSDSINLTLENQFKALLVDLQIPNLQTKLYDQQYVLNSLIETRFLAQSDSINMSAFKIKRGESFIVGSGVANGDVVAGEIETAKGSIRTYIEIPSTMNLAKKFDPKLQLPEATGAFSLDTTLDYKKGQIPNANFSLKSKDVTLKGYEIGNLTALGTFAKKSFKFSTLKLQNSSGSANFNETQISTTGNYKFKTTLNPNTIELTALLDSIKVRGVPLYLDVGGSIPCGGQLKNFQMDCTGQLKGKNLHVWSGEKRKTIVKIKTFSAQGAVKVDLEKVSYKADLKLGEAEGKSSGSISYKNGFDINYETPQLDFTNVQNLVDLKVEGATKIKGRTWGTSKWARIAMDVDGKDFWLENHALGNVKSKVSYKQGKLFFRQIRGSINNSLYGGVVTVDVLKNQIYLNVNSKYFNVDDVFFAFSRRGQLPFDFTGTGNAKVKAWGPLAFNKLSYNLNAELYRGTLFEESFDEVRAQLTAKSGYATINKLNLSKANSYARFTGTIDPQGTLDTRIVGTNFRLSEFQRVKDMGLNLEGRLDAVMQLKGFILSPNLEIEGNLQEVLIAGEPQKNSSFSLKYDDNSFGGNGQFLGKTINTEFEVPFKANLPFRFKLSSKDWDFIKLFNLVSGSAIKRNYRTRLTTSINLSSPRGGFWKSTGKVVIPEVRVQRNNLVMFNEKPMELNFRNGVISSKNFRVVNEAGDFVQIVTNGMTRNNLNSELKGQFDLGLAAILTPLDDLGGDANFSLSTSGNINDFKIIGDAFVKNSIARVADFPHAFEDLNADLLFNEKRILINSARARLAEGQLTGSGRVLFNGFKDIPIDIKADLSGAKMNVPSGVLTEGNASVYIAGKWFPYTLGGTYTVNKGIVEKEFETGASSGKVIQPSNFLPKFLNQERFAPLKFNMDVILANPIRMQNSLADIPLDGRVKITGPVDSPKLTGQFDLQPGGRMNYRDAEFDLQSGSVIYKNSSPENPILNVTANTVLESQEVNYDITMLLQGKADNPRIKLSSSPPLEDLDIISLLGFGYTRGDLEKINQDEQAAQTSYQIGSALLASPIGKEIKDRFGVDMQISSDLDENYKTEPKLTLKKQINNNVSASASRTLGKTPKTKITGEYKISDNLSVIGFFESTEPNTEEEKDAENLDTTGFDLEYKIQFK